MMIELILAATLALIAGVVLGRITKADPPRHQEPVRPARHPVCIGATKGGRGRYRLIGWDGMAHGKMIFTGGPAGFESLAEVEAIAKKLCNSQFHFAVPFLQPTREEMRLQNKALQKFSVRETGTWNHRQLYVGDVRLALIAYITMESAWEIIGAPEDGMTAAGYDSLDAIRSDPLYEAFINTLAIPFEEGVGVGSDNR